MLRTLSAPWAIAMWWRDICTMHWRVEPRAIESLLPAGLTLDRHEGAAWLSVVPFRMCDVRLRFAPVLRGFASVPEINLRTYVRAGSSRGIYFFSLDAASPLMVRSAQIVTGLPYRDARILMVGSGTQIRFQSVRAAGNGVPGDFDARYEPYGEAREAEPGSLEAFLHERYRFFLRRFGRLWSGEVRHEPWRLQRTYVDVAANTLGALAGRQLAASPEHCWFARRLRVHAGVVRPYV